jgi:hypothetical protein
MRLAAIDPTVAAAPRSLEAPLVCLQYTVHTSLRLGRQCYRQHSDYQIPVVNHGVESTVKSADIIAGPSALPSCLVIVVDNGLAAITVIIFLLDHGLAVVWLLQALLRSLDADLEAPHEI